jgi:hypothetical protein
MARDRRRNGMGIGVWIAAALTLALLAPARSGASIPDADIHQGVNSAGFGMISGAYGHADFGISERSAVGGYLGTDPNDLFFGDFDAGDRSFNSNTVVGGHYMYQFVEGGEHSPNVSGIFGAFANRDGLRPELGFGLSYPLSDRVTGRANVVYGPSWGFELGYRFNPSVEGTIGVTGMGMLGLGFRF